jgi:hypothetical protein
MHSGDRWDPQAFGFQAKSSARQTIAPGAKGGAREENIRLQVSQVALDLGDYSFFMLAKVTIAAHNGGDHLSLIAQELLQESPRSERSVLEADRGVRFLFTPQSPEKRVDVM